MVDFKISVTFLMAGNSIIWKHIAVEGDLIFMNPVQDGVTITKICNGERDKFRELVEAYQEQVFAIAFAGLRDRELAEEAVQEAFIRAYTNLRGLRKPEKFGPWLCAITRRVVLLLLRRERGNRRQIRETAVMCGKATPVRRSSAVLDNEKTEPAEEVHQREVSAVLLETLERLPHHLAETLTVFYIQEKSVSETAELLGVSEATVKTRLHRGRELMRQPLERILDEELRHLKPSRNLTPGVMAMLPGLTMKTGWTAGLSSIPILILGSQIVAFGAIILLSDHLFQRSFKNPGGYRATLYLYSMDPLKMFLFMAIFSLVAMSLLSYLGEKWYWIVFGLFFLFGAIINLPNDLRIWKVGNKTFLLSSVILACMGLFYLSTFFIPQLKDFQILTTVGVMILVLLSRNDKIMRQDISLFLREVKHELPMGGEIESLKLSSSTRKAFAHFLGREMLVWGDEYLADGSCVFGLAPVKKNHFFSRSWQSLSKITIDGQGNFKSSLALEDLDKLERIEKRKISEAEVTAMEEKVAGAVRASAMFFSQGKLEQALGALSLVSDDEIFENGKFCKTSIARFDRWNRIFAIVMILIAIIMTLIDKTIHSDQNRYQKNPLPVYPTSFKNPNSKSVQSQPSDIQGKKDGFPPARE
jgi:RNA polymerase sigma factor (sigma-70 family)